MIYTCTLNPAIDYYISLNDFKINSINRGTTMYFVPGGKGINVSIILSRLTVKNKALGFCGGEYGKMLIDLLAADEIDSDFTMIKGQTRQNIKIRGHDETDINTNGPQVSKVEFNQLLEKIKQLNECDYLVMAGKSVEISGMFVNDEIGKMAKEKKFKLVVDAERQDLLDFLKYQPFLIKPNLEELEELVQKKLTNQKEMEMVCKDLIKTYQITYILLSLGGAGAMLVSEDKTYYQKAPSGIVVNTVGAGDSMLAGFLSAYTNNFQLEEALKMGVACGSATTFKDHLATKDEIEALLESFNII